MFMFRYYSLLLSLLLFSSLSANIGGGKKKHSKANKMYKGYVITLEGDTLKGKIEMLSPSLNEVKVKLVPNDGEAIIYRAKEITAYAFLVPDFDIKKKRFNDKWIFYVKKKVERPPVPFGPTEVLMQQEIKGTISFYNYYIETRSQVADFEHLTLIEKDGEMLKIAKANYKKVLKTMIIDYPKLAKKIGKKGYRFKNLKQILTLYNSKKKNNKHEPNFSAL